MKEKERIQLALDLVYQQVEDFGMIPNLKVSYILSTLGEKTDALDVLSAFKNYDILFVNPAIEKGNELKRYSYSFVDVSDVRHGDKTIVSRISPNWKKYTNYNDMLKDFSQLVTNIYYDFDGKISIKLGSDELELSPNYDLSSGSYYARNEIAKIVETTLQNQVMEYANNQENQSKLM